MKNKIITIFAFFLSFYLNAEQTEITTTGGIEVFKQEKYYLLKENVIIDSDNFKLNADLVKAYFEKDLYDITRIEEARSFFRSISRPSIASLGSAAGPIGFAKQ